MLDLLDREEELTLQLSAEASVTYRRLLPEEYTALTKACQTDDKASGVDWDAVITKALARGIKAWTGILLKGQPAEISEDSCGRFPIMVRTQLFNAIVLGQFDIAVPGSLLKAAEEVRGAAPLVRLGSTSSDS